MRKRKLTIHLIIIFFVGLSILSYPFLSDYLNRIGAAKAVNNYDENVRLLDGKKSELLFNEAYEYNQKLFSNPKEFHSGEIVSRDYMDLLNILGDGMMGYITIKKIGVNLPIYHGTTNKVLNKAVGHLEGSSLPVGGINTHAVLTGHRGLPSAKLFTDLDRLELGDTFSLNVLNKSLVYEIDDIKIVEPEEVNNLEIVPEKDYVTLVTCTPYAVNTHRLLVRGKRIDLKDVKIVVGDAVRLTPLIAAMLFAIPILIVLGMIVMLPAKKGRNGS